MAIIFTKWLRLWFIISFVLMLVIFVVLGTSEYSLGFWPFTSKKKDIMAKVGRESITKEEFIDEISRLHKSDRAGEVLSKEKFLAKQDFNKFLDELIENKLMAIEAVNLAYDKEASFISQMDNYILNLSLERLRQDEITNKVKVDEQEIEAYYQEQLKKQNEEKKKAQGKADRQKTTEEKTDTSKEDVAKENIKNEDSQKEAPADKTEEPKQMSPADREAIRKGLLNEKGKIREKEYFNYLKKRSRINVNDEILKEISPEKTDTLDKEIANVNGEPILVVDLLRSLNSLQQLRDEAVKKEALEKVILYRMLDQEALSRGYEKEGEIKKKVERRKEELLIDQFKKKAILPTVKIEEKDILEYYKTNQEKYRESDKVNLKIIHITNEEEALTVFNDLKKGADFSYLAKEKSIDPSKEKGGDIGWVQVNHLSDEIVRAVAEAKRGDILGPFKLQIGYVIVEFRGLEKGAYIPIEMVRKQIDKTIGTERFNTTLKVYIKQLREAIPIEINQEYLNNMQGN